jgi:hypothetical protein
MKIDIGNFNLALSVLETMMRDAADEIERYDGKLSKETNPVSMEYWKDNKFHSELYFNHLILIQQLFKEAIVDEE